MNNSSSILITGASTGIGKACAQHLSSHNWRVFAGVRNETDFPSLQCVSDSITPLLLDVTNPASIDAALSKVASSVGQDGLCAVINNAGIAVGGPLEFVSPEAFELQIRTNTLGPFLVTRACLPLLRQHAQKHLDARVINISSVSGLVAFPFVGPYAASKFALEALTEAWRHELANANIRFSLIEPGPIKTPIWQKTRQKLQEVPHLDKIESLYPGYASLSLKMIDESEQKGIDAVKVAELVHKALISKNPRLRYPIGPGSRLARLRKFIPQRVWEMLVKSELKKLMRSPDSGH